MSSLYKHLGPWGKFFFTLYTIVIFSFYGSVLYALWIFVLAPIYEALIRPLILFIIIVLGMGQPYSGIMIVILIVIAYFVLLLNSRTYKD